MIDQGSIPDLAQHFVTAAQYFIPIVSPVLYHAMDLGVDFWTGLTQQEAMTPGMRHFQLLKLGGSTIGLGICLAAQNFEGSIGWVLSEGEAVMAFCRAGHKYRTLHPPGPGGG